MIIFGLPFIIVVRLVIKAALDVLYVQGFLYLYTDFVIHISLLYLGKEKPWIIPGLFVYYKKETMAKIKDSSVRVHISNHVERPGIHAKTKTSKLKSSKNYKKAYRGQGR